MNYCKYYNSLDFESANFIFSGMEQSFFPPIIDGTYFKKNVDFDLEDLVKQT